MSFIAVYVTHKNREEAEKVVSHLLNKKLIACVNFFPIESMYWWKNKLDRVNEIVSLIKTKKENWIKIKSEIKKIHSYEVPCIMKFDVEANDDYEAWVRSETE